MKIILILAAVVFFASCKKEQPTCYICKQTENNQTKVFTACGEKPAPSFTNANGEIIFVTCVKK